MCIALMQRPGIRFEKKDAICSSILLVCMINLIPVIMIMFYLPLILIKLYGYLLIYSTIEKPDYRQNKSKWSC
jgi:hypothetical protein